MRLRESWRRDPTEVTAVGDDDNSDKDDNDDDGDEDDNEDEPVTMSPAATAEKLELLLLEDWIPVSNFAAE